MSSASASSGITQLPDAVIAKIGSSLTPLERAHLRRVNRKFKKAIEEECHVYPLSNKTPSFHPLLPSSTFYRFMTLQDRATAIFVAISFGFRHGCTQYAGQAISTVTYFPPLEHIYWAPSILAYNILGINQKASWAAPMGGIIIYTLAAYKLYALYPASFFVQGLIYGIHSIAITRFTNAPPTANMLGFCSLLTPLQIFRSPRQEVISHADRLAISEKSDKLSGLASLVVNGIASITLKNPILATAIALPISAVVKVTTMRILINQAPLLQPRQADSKRTHVTIFEDRNRQQ